MLCVIRRYYLLTNNFDIKINKDKIIIMKLRERKNFDNFGIY